jgi:hypothetical protein
VELKFAGVLARRNLHAKVKDFEPLTMAEKSNGLAGAELRCEWISSISFLLLRSAESRHSAGRDRTAGFDPKPSSNHADKLAPQVVTPSFPW